jgi:hypothetical protein
VLPPAAGDVVAFVDLRKQRGNVLGRMLQIPIHGNHHAALRLVESGGECGGLPEIAPQTDHLQVSIGLGKIRQQFEAAIRGCVIYENDFVRALQRLKYPLSDDHKAAESRALHCGWG